MPVRQFVVILAALALVAAACTPAAPAASPAEPAAPTPATGTPTPEPDTPTPPPTPTAEATVTPVSDPSVVDDYGDPYGGGAVRTPTPAPDGDGATLELHSSTDAGDYLVGPAGLALYTFASDHPGMSTCTGTCARTWPPLTLEEGEEPTAGEGIDGTLGTIERGVGSRQVTYNDQPLYYFVSDASIDDTTGEGFGGVWFLARPDAGDDGGGGIPEY